ncbi:hypothetical protein GCM10009304_01720 [Pseudomonas matsuisoli]|uniref:Uncharacterized protein n=1 Tax=Pseudomonas matsuisoli TaxID=1515666 RepID=A0A917PHX4_9PSED|nr:hypothetical protein GCM10009304_01720 [Pseudomonas matsuisoli]
MASRIWPSVTPWQRHTYMKDLSDSDNVLAILMLMRMIVKIQRNAAMSGQLGCQGTLTFEECQTPR